MRSGGVSCVCASPQVMTNEDYFRERAKRKADEADDDDDDDDDDAPAAPAPAGSSSGFEAIEGGAPALVPYSAALPLGGVEPEAQPIASLPPQPQLEEHQLPARDASMPSQPAPMMHPHAAQLAQQHQQQLYAAHQAQLQQGAAGPSYAMPAPQCHPQAALPQHPQSFMPRPHHPSVIHHPGMYPYYAPQAAPGMPIHGHYPAAAAASTHPPLPQQPPGSIYAQPPPPQPPPLMPPQLMPPQLMPPQGVAPPPYLPPQGCIPQPGVVHQPGVGGVGQPQAGASPCQQVEIPPQGPIHFEQQQPQQPPSPAVAGAQAPPPAQILTPFSSQPEG